MSMTSERPVEGGPPWPTADEGADPDRTGPDRSAYGGPPPDAETGSGDGSYGYSEDGFEHDDGYRTREYGEAEADFEPPGSVEADTVPVFAALSTPAGPHEPWDPASVKGTGSARRIRVLTGVAEPLLDRIPTERARYTALACVMVCTSTVSGISMFFAISEILGSSSPWYLPFALFWAGFILSVDRWLVAASPNKHSFVKIQTLLMRLAIAVVLGFIIAEPLLLRVFQTAVVNQVDKDWSGETNYGVHMYTLCNPLPGRSVPTGLDCTNWSLNVSGADPAADQAQIDKVQADITSLTTELDAENGKLGSLGNFVNEECNGQSGPGLTGHVGNGPACHADQQQYDNYKTSQPFAKQNSELSSDEAELASLRGQLTTDTASMGAAITGQIKAWVSQQPATGSKIGLIERFKALVELSDNSVVVSFGAWLLRLFFVLIDCLPVLVKFIGGSTPYDDVARGEIRIAQELLQVEGRTRVKAAEIHQETRIKWEIAQAAKHEKSINAEVLDHAAALEVGQWEAIDHDYELRLSRLGLTPDRKKDDASETASSPEYLKTQRLPRTPTAKVNGHAFKAA